jgi:hypothetical protein
MQCFGLKPWERDDAEEGKKILEALSSTDNNSYWFNLHGKSQRIQRTFGKLPSPFSHSFSVCLVYSGPSAFRIAITVISLHSTGPLQPRLNCTSNKVNSNRKTVQPWLEWPSRVKAYHRDSNTESPCPYRSEC